MKTLKNYPKDIRMNIMNKQDDRLQTTIFDKEEPQPKKYEGGKWEWIIIDEIEHFVYSRRVDGKLKIHIVNKGEKQND